MVADINREAAESVAAEIQQTGAQSLACQVDVSKVDSVEKLKEMRCIALGGSIFWSTMRVSIRFARLRR